MFYHFRQNNSGGRFVFDKKNGLSVNVIIEADSAEKANSLAEDIGIYFNGCSHGSDCHCCGDRWYTVSEYDGRDKPSVYGKEVVKDQPHSDTKWIKNGPECFIHYKDGRIEPSLI